MTRKSIKRGEGGACPNCFVTFGTQPEPCDPVNENCRRCSPGWGPRENPKKIEKEESVVPNATAFGKDAGAARWLAAREYSKRKGTALGLLTLEDFSSTKNRSTPLGTANPEPPCALQGEDRDDEESAGGGHEVDCTCPACRPMECQYKNKLRKVAQRCVDFLKADRGLTPVGKLPEVIECGGLRPAVRSCYTQLLSVSDELSIKTSQKLELDACKFCMPVFDAKKKQWREKVGRPRPVDDEHLKFFRKVLKGNVPLGWNRAAPATAFVPNGHGALGKLHSRKNGGNWNVEAFSDACRTELVFSSGKPRVVTLFSSFNQEVLRPLHRSLYACLGKYSWLLQGPPTEEKIATLEGGDFHSFDFASATDSLGARYVGAMVDELVAKGTSLTDDQIRCMRVLEKQDLGDGWSQSGQPMGSLMSFPLLCLVNKTLMDMSLIDSLGIRSKHIPKGNLAVYTSHKCLINGDDALVRDPPNQRKPFRECFVYHGEKIGLVVNQEKSLRSSSLAEINSTCFLNGREQKKTNLKVLGIGKKDVGDVIGVVSDATVCSRGFTFGLAACAGALKLQSDKKIALHPERIGIIKNNKKIRAAIRQRPTSVIEKERNLLPVVDRPEGYDLFPSQEREVLTRMVEKLRPARQLGSAFNAELFEQKRRIKKQIRNAEYCAPMNANRVCRQRGKTGKESILACLARAWYDEMKDLTDNRWFLPPSTAPARTEEETCATIVRLIQMIRCPDIT
jgi:hypothetical protein